MMSLSGLYSLFFAITVGAFAPTEASSVPAAVNPASAPSPVTFALLADQHQQNNNIIPVQKESALGPREQKKIRLANILATAGTTAAILIFVLIFMTCAKQMKEFLTKEREEEKKERRPEDKVDKPKKKPKELTPEQELQLELKLIGAEVGFEDEAMTEDEIRKEAERRIERRKEILDSIRWAAGSEGKTLDDLKKRAFRDEAYEREKKRARRYNYKVERERWLEEEWPKLWGRRERIRERLEAELFE